MKTLVLLALLFPIFASSQISLIDHINGNYNNDGYDLQACSASIMGHDEVTRNHLKVYSNLIMMQSGTVLHIKRFTGETTIIHGSKAQEDLINYVKPVLLIDRCSSGSVVRVSNRVEIKHSGNCQVIRINQ